MTWNNRVVHRAFHSGGGEDGTEHSFAVHEVYYDSEGRAYAVTSEPVDPGGETLEELKENMSRFSLAMLQPVLEFDEIPEPGAVDPAGDIT